MYTLAMMSNVIYFNIFTIKHEMDRPAWCVLCGVLRGEAAWEDWGALRTALGSWHLEGRKKLKEEVMEEEQAT